MLKILLRDVSLLLMVVIINGCSETATKVDDREGQIQTSIESPCGEQYYNFYIDRTVLAGYVRVANDLDYVYITYYFDTPYLAKPKGMDIWMGPSAPTKRGEPKHYPFHSTNSDYVSTYSFTFTNTEVQQYLVNGKFYFMTYASVVTPREGGRYNKPEDGYSEIIINYKSKGAWFGYNSYILRDCGAM